MKNLIQAAHDGGRENSTPVASFEPFDSSSELWLDYLEILRTFCTVNSIPKENKAQVFLTNQTTVTYKLPSVAPCLNLGRVGVCVWSHSY